MLVIEHDHKIRGTFARSIKKKTVVARPQQELKVRRLTHRNREFVSISEQDCLFFVRVQVKVLHDRDDLRWDDMQSKAY